MISVRLGPIPGILLRWALFMPVSLVVSRRTFRVSASGLRPVRPFLARGLAHAWLACARAAAVPEVAITSGDPQSTRNAAPPCAVRAR